MNSLFDSTTVIEEASMTVKKRGIVRITLIFLLVYFLGAMLSGFVMYIPLFGFIAGNEELIDIASNGTQAEFENALVELMNEMPQWFSPVTLISTAGIIIVTLYYCTRLERRRLFTLGFVKKDAFAEYMAGFGIGFILFSAAYGIMLLSGQAKFNGFNSQLSIPLLLLFFVGYLIQGASEEILCRGYYFVSCCCPKKNIALAIFLSSVMFSLFHGGNNGISLMAVLNLFLFGILAALYFLRRGSIWGVCALHSIWNFTQGNIFGCSVSGNEVVSSVFLTSYGEAGMFNGGSFGPEGGLGVTIVLFIGIVILLFMKNKDVRVQYNGEFYSA